jgi:lipopolysaccharide export system protein LptA
MLRGTRSLLLLAILLIVGAVATSYYTLRRFQAIQAPPRPQALPLNTDAAAQSWVWRKDEATHGIVEVRARRFRRLTAPDLVEIEGVEVIVYKQGGQEYNDIRSAKAQFDEAQDRLYSDGEVDILMNVPATGLPRTQPLEIHSSGVTYEGKTGKAYTDRAATFSFDQGDGKCVGAIYDPAAGELTMRSQVELNWRGRDPNTKPMKIEAGQLVYREKDSYVVLGPWSRLTRDTMVLDAAESHVTLNNGAIEKVDSERAHGVDRQPARQLDYSADRLFMTMDAHGRIEAIRATPNARLVSLSETARTTATADRLDLSFDAGAGENVLKRADAFGHGVMEAVPVARPGVEQPETRVLRSETIQIDMRPGGQEIDTVKTHAPGRLEFLPNRPALQHHRILDAERMTIAYADANVIRLFTGWKTATRTDPLPPSPPKPGETQKKTPEPAPPRLTSSKELRAEFDPKTGQLTRLEQWDDFRYQEGERRATADRAVLEQQSDRITLERKARVWDASGATAADRVLLDQKSGDVAADGNVFSTRLPDSKGPSSAMLTNDRPLQAQADRMTTTDRNHKVRYEGRAVAWQGANRIWGDVIDIDRTQRVLSASGHVRTRFLEQQKEPVGKPADGKPAAAPASAPAVVTIQAAALRYTEADRLAYYTGGVHLVRPGMDVKSAELRAWLNDSSADSSLNHAFADGEVTIVRTEPLRVLTGAGVHAEYYAANERIFLAGGDATLLDSAHGLTKGRELTYYANLDKLLVNGMPKDPVRTQVRRRR